MSILLAANNRNMVPFRDELQRLDPHIDIEIWPDCDQPERVQFIVAWDQSPHFFHRFPNLKVVSSMGAGVEHLVGDPDLPSSVAITRIVDSSLQEQIRDYVVSSLYRILRRSDEYLDLQRAAEWKKLEHTTRGEWPVGILGLGQLGRFVVEHLERNGWDVHGWSRSPKAMDRCTTWAGPNSLPAMLAHTRIVVNLLPLTSETEGILNLSVFKQMANPSWLIHAGRGEQLIEEDLIYALDTGVMEGAFLDVFHKEPLPETHPFWNRQAIRITPHIASVSHAGELAPLLLENYKRMISNQELLYKVNREQGY